MSKRKFVQFNEVLFNSFWVTKFTNKFVRHGKKALVIKFVKLSFINIKKKVKILPIYILYKTLFRIRLPLGITVRRKGKRLIDIPTDITKHTQWIRALKWIVVAVKINKAKLLRKKISNVLLSSCQNQRGAAYIKWRAVKIQLRAARLNLHYRWK